MFNHEVAWRNFTARTASSPCTGTNTDLDSSELSPALCSLLLSPQQAHECPNHATLLGTGSGLQLTVTSKHGCILELSLVEVSPHSHADATLCLNKQVGEHSMSTILIHLIPQEFNTVAGGLY